MATAGSPPDRGDNNLRVRFPAEREFARVGRVAVAGLALRLRIDVAMVENLRVAIDEGIAALAGAGNIDLTVTWQSGSLDLSLANSDVTIEQGERESVRNKLLVYVDEVNVGANEIRLGLVDR